MSHRNGHNGQLTGHGGAKPFVTVHAPPTYEGVGNALRCAYKAGSPTLPSDMLALLNQLDGR